MSFLSKAFEFIKKFAAPIVFILKAVGSVMKANGQPLVDDKVAEAIKKVGSAVEILSPILDPATTQAVKNAISADSAEYKGITAKLVPNKHGEGNAGIEISYSDGNTSVTYDPKDGSIKGGISIRL